MRSPPKGFTIVEITIVVALIGLVSAFAAPNITRMRISGNEAGAQMSLGTLRSAFESYRAPNGRFPISLLQLGPAGSTPPYIDSDIADGTAKGYTYVLSNITNDTYRITAVPAQPLVTGVRRFEIDQSGEIRELSSIASPAVGGQGGARSSLRGADAARRSGRWYTTGDGDVYTNWRDEWIEYKVDFGNESGWFDLGMAAKNDAHHKGWKAPEGYKFEVDVTVDGIPRGTITIDGSDTEYKSGNVEVPLSAGLHTVKYTWGNDYYDPKNNIDANIRVKEVTFNKVEKGNQGKSDQAPGQTGQTPGQSGNTPGQGGDIPGQSGTTPGQSGNTPQ